MNSIVIPVNPQVLEKLVRESDYPEKETAFLVEGFTKGFSIGYEDPQNRQQRANNLPLRVGSFQHIWDKVQKEVKLGRYAGPFYNIPFDTYIQSLIGLVRKDLNDVHLIFHLSHPRGTSLNDYTSEHLCKVKYRDLDNAVRLCLKESKSCYMAKSDMKSAF